MYTVLQICPSDLACPWSISLYYVSVESDLNTN